MQNKFLKIESEMNKFFFNRTDEIHGMLLSMISGPHLGIGANLVNISAPGTGKTLMFEKLMECISNDLPLHNKDFKVLFHPTLKLSETVGPEDLEKFINEKKLVRNSKNFLPNCYFGFGDEIFKANDVQLNPLLTMMNEHKYQIDGIWNTIPLISLFCASNEYPQGNLQAFRDRLLFWYKIDYLKDPVMRLEYLKAHKYDINISDSDKLKISEIFTAQQEVYDTVVTDDTYDMLLNILIKLEEKGIVNSDRRQRQIIPVIKSSAWFHGNKETCIEDCIEIIPCLWNDEKEIVTVKQVVISECNNQLQKILDLQDVCVDTFRHKNDYNSNEELKKKFDEIKINIELIKPSNRNILAHKKLDKIWNLYMVAITKATIAEKEAGRIK